jgi:FMN reductase
MTTRYLVISCSLNNDSRSRLLAQLTLSNMQKKTDSVEFIDLGEFSLPLCDGGSCYEDPQVQSLTQRIAHASGVVVATPIYNFDANAAAKNLIELTGSAWNEKVVGLVSAAGGQASYMSVMGLANSLMLDFRCLIVPRLVYAAQESFTGDLLNDAKIEGRLQELVDRLFEITEKLTPTSNS